MLTPFTKVSYAVFGLSLVGFRGHLGPCICCVNARFIGSDDSLVKALQLAGVL